MTPLYVTSLTIQNLRCFQEAKLKLQHAEREGAGAAPERRNINLLLGNNGAGKTSVLRALALATLAPVIEKSSGYVPYRLIRRASPGDLSVKSAEITAEVILHSQDVNASQSKTPLTEKMSMRVERQGDVEHLVAGKRLTPSPGKTNLWSNMFDDKSPAFLVVGYGATRRVDDSVSFNINEQTKLRQLRYLRVAGLFESHLALIPLKSWLPKMKTENPGRHKQVVNLIDRLLPDESSFSGNFINDEYYFELAGTEIPFGALSDGYRAYIGWIGDLLYHVCMGAPKGAKLVENRGLVLVDEIDLHLHPAWQRTVIENISESLPNLQFVFSTHSPIVAGSLHKENIYVLDTDASGASTVEQYRERIYGLNAEQVLLSSYFKLKTTRAEGYVENELRPLSQKAMQGDAVAAEAFIDKLAGKVVNAASAAAAKAEPSSGLRLIDNTKFQQLLVTYGKDGGSKRGSGRAKTAARKSGATKRTSRSSKKR